MISKVGQVMALVTACLLWGSLALAEPEVPEFFGVYVKMKDGRLIELRSVVPYQYKAFNKHRGEPSLEDNDIFRALTSMDRPPTYYLRGKPALALHASDIMGFFVCGDYPIRSFMITEFVPSPVNNQETILIEGSDTGPGIRNPNNFIDSKFVFSLERHFRYIEKKPKIYWIVPRENTGLGDVECSFLAIKFSDAENYWPFSVSRDEKDYVVAAERYRKAAEQGEAIAQNNLGFAYTNGQGVPQDYAKAREWYQKAAEQGEANAQSNLGFAYARGQGVPQDYAKAREWYQKAAEQNNIYGFNALAWLYATCEDGNFRNGPKAVEYALKATSVKTDSWAFFNVRAAAYARNNEFDKAIEAAQQSIELLVKNAAEEKKEKWLQRAKDRLELYRKHEAYVDYPDKGDEETAKSRAKAQAQAATQIANRAGAISGTIKIESSNGPGVYSAIVLTQIERNFKPPYSRSGLECRVSFTIQKDGTISNIQIVKTTGNPELDNYAVRAIQETGKLQPLYDNSPVNYLDMIITFSYERKNET